MNKSLSLVLMLCVLSLSSSSHTHFACSHQAASGECDQCMSGFYYLQFVHYGTSNPLFQNVPAFCVPDCSLHPMFRNNDTTGHCEMCPVFDQSNSLDTTKVCLRCLESGQCEESVSLNELDAAYLNS